MGLLQLDYEAFAPVAQVLVETPVVTAVGFAATNAQARIVAKIQYGKPESTMATGSVSTHAIAMLRTVAHCSPDPLAAVEGRKVFGNITKYIKMGASSNFGDMFSVLGASLFLPRLQIGWRTH